MKSRIKFTLLITLFGLMGSLAQAGFTSIRVFGDSLSTATANSPVGPDYYGDRWSNGRVWAEVLAQGLGLTFNLAANTDSYWGNTSSDLVGEVSHFTPPAAASNVLVVIWVNNADLYFPATATPPTLANFNAVINQAQTDHYKAITNLYAKGIRTLVMPNVVDISTVPGFNTYTAYTNLFHLASTNYNAKFYSTLERARTNCPGLKIYVPDFYTLLADLLAQPNVYGVTNAKKNGLSIDALSGLPGASLASGPGTNYIFWDKTDPTAKVHNIMARAAQQMISPVQIGQILTSDSSNRLDVINMPLGAICMIESCSNLLAKSWVTNASFIGTSPQQSVFVSKVDPTTTVQPQVKPKIPLPDGNPGILVDFRVYRLELPYNWVWP